MGLPVPSIQDIAAIVLGNEADVERALRDYYERGGATFSYEPARKIGTKFLGGGLKAELAVGACFKIGSPSGHKQNAEVVRLLCDWAAGREFRFYGIRTDFLPIGPRFAIPVPIQGYLVEKGAASFLWMQPRKGFNPNSAQLSMIATCIRDVYGREDFEKVGLTILDFAASMNDSERSLNVFGFEDFELLSRAELSELLGIFAAAYRSLVQVGYTKPTRPSREKRPDERQSDFFEFP